MRDVIAHWGVLEAEATRIMAAFDAEDAEEEERRREEERRKRRRSS